MLINSSLRQQPKYIFHKSIRNSRVITNENSGYNINYLTNNNSNHQDYSENSSIVGIDVIMPSTHDNFYTKNESFNDSAFSPTQNNFNKKKIGAAKRINSEKNYFKINPYTKQNITNDHSNKIIKNDFFINGNNNDVTVIAPEILYNFDSPKNNMKKINLFKDYKSNVMNKRSQLRIQQSNNSNNIYKNIFDLDNQELIGYNNIKNRSYNQINSPKTPKIQCKKKIKNYKFRNNPFEANYKKKISQKQNKDFHNKNSTVREVKNINDINILNNKNNNKNQLRNISRSNRYHSIGNKTNSYINHIKDTFFLDASSINDLMCETSISTHNNIQNNSHNSTQHYTQNNNRKNINNKTQMNESNNVNKLKNYPSLNNLCINKEKLLNKPKLNSSNNSYNNLNVPGNLTLNYNSRGNFINGQQKSLLNESNKEKNNNIFEKTFNNFNRNSKIEIIPHDKRLNSPVYQINDDKNENFCNNNQLIKSCSKLQVSNSTTNLRQNNINNLNKIYKKPEKLKKNKQFNNSTSFINKQSFAKDLNKDIININNNNSLNKKESTEKKEHENNNDFKNNENLNSPISKHLNIFKRKVFGSITSVTGANKTTENLHNKINNKNIRVSPDVKIETIAEKYDDDESEINEDDTIIINDSYVHGGTINLSNNCSNYKNMNRYFKKYNSLSQAGKEINCNSQKINQDLPIIYISINGIVGFNLFGVLDGHGVNGHHVSKFLGEFITNELSNLKEIAKLKDLDLIYEKFKQKNYEIIINLFLNADKCLFTKKNIGSDLSGSTCVIIIQIGKHLLSANVGDSRAILIHDENEIFELSHDFKPGLPKEKERIHKMGGIVDRMTDLNGIKRGPLRVWAKNRNYPGLAMSRSIGDFKGKECGIICIPEIIEYNLNEKSKYMVISSDGVWEFLSNEDVMNIGNLYYIQNDIIGFTNKLIETATRWWEREDIIIDDITAVIVFF